jgi:hypothetical protein
MSGAKQFTIPRLPEIACFGSEFLQSLSSCNSNAPDADCKTETAFTGEKGEWLNPGAQTASS